jgi:competence ComEA-like helix-hairpin-helix protein
MASSPTSIDDATTEELCQLDYIGPRRAERIIRYREQIGRIETIDQLAEAADLSTTQAREIADQLSLSARRPPSIPDLLLLVMVLIASTAYASWNILEQGLGLVTPAEITLNISLLAIVAACVVAVINTVILRNPIVSLISVALAVSGVLLGSALALSVHTGTREDEFSIHVLTTWRLMVFAISVIGLQFLPGWTMELTPRGIFRAGRVFDLALLPTAVLLAFFVFMTMNDQWVEEIFSLWAGVVFLQAGFTLSRGNSAFVATLTDEQRSRHMFRVMEEGDASEPESSYRWHGRALIFMGLVFLGIVTTSVTINF